MVKTEHTPLINPENTRCTAIRSSTDTNDASAIQHKWVIREEEDEPRTNSGGGGNPVPLRLILGILSILLCVSILVISSSSSSSRNRYFSDEPNWRIDFDFDRNHNDDTSKNDHGSGSHILPTLLSIRNIDDGTFIHPHTNPLYESMQSSYHDYDDDDEIMNTHHRIWVDQDYIQFHKDITVHWSSNNPSSNDDDKDKQHRFAKEVNNLIRDDDVIALYCPANETNPTNFWEAATVKQARSSNSAMNGDNDDGASWHIPSFPIIREETCSFRLLRGHPPTTSSSSNYDVERTNSNVMKVLARSNTIQVVNSLSTPTGIHLALTEYTDEMRVHFATGQKGIPIVQFGEATTTTTEDLVSSRIRTAQGRSHSYTASDLCMAPANESRVGKFISPGNLHVVTLNNLVEDTMYAYRLGVVHNVNATNDSFFDFIHRTNHTYDGGANDDMLNDDNVVWSEIYTFRSALPPATAPSEQHSPYSFIVYGDQGCPSNGWGDGSTRTQRLVQREVLNHHPNNISSTIIRAIHHVGDLSYAMGAAHVWDAWLAMIQPITARVPFMISVGNHEYDHTNGGGGGVDPSGVLTSGGFNPVWGDMKDNSAGECGVPTSARFVMPQFTNHGNGNKQMSTSANNGVYWYSYNIASTHIIVISSEHDLSPSSPQHQWLLSDLSNVQRNLTPWLIVESHRPLYESQIRHHHDSINTTLVTEGMRHEIEPLLKDYSVDLFLNGHYHAYLRTCDGLYNNTCENGGPTHITVGSAGAVLLHADLYRQAWTKQYLVEYGYGKVTIMNRTVLLWEFISDEHGEVMDELWLRK